MKGNHVKNIQTRKLVNRKIKSCWFASLSINLCNSDPVNTS